MQTPGNIDAICAEIPTKKEIKIISIHILPNKMFKYEELVNIQAGSKDNLILTVDFNSFHEELLSKRIKNKNNKVL